MHGETQEPKSAGLWALQSLRIGIHGHSQMVTPQVATSPNTVCSITVVYSSGPSVAAGLGAAPSDASAEVSWTWKVGGRTTPGTWPITVTCGSGSNNKTITVG